MSEDYEVISAESASFGNGDDEVEVVVIGDIIDSIEARPFRKQESSLFVFGGGATQQEEVEEERRMSANNNDTVAPGEREIATSTTPTANFGP